MRERLFDLTRNVKKDKYLLLLFAPVAIYFIIFSYIPMYGLIIAFKDFKINDGILGSPWVGLEWFDQFFSSMYFTRLLRNTVLIQFYSLIFGFPLPILFALMLNELKDGIFKRVNQTISYFPHFISTVIVVGMLFMFLSPTDGIINTLLNHLGLASHDFLGDHRWFRTIYVTSGIWQSFGWGSILYLGAISGIDPQLYESAKIDGAGRLKQIMHITIPGIRPVIIILLILDIGHMFNVGYEKIILMYSPATYETADVISTYIYRSGIVGGDFGYSTAIGLFNAVISFLLIALVNQISKKVFDIYLW